MPDAIGVNLYRLRSGKIVEHWDAMEPSYGGVDSLNMIAGPTEVEDIDSTELNRELARDFVKQV